ncbi:GMC oxidoreductase [Paracoccus lutimaris]|uniref:Choline dehydrogenase-like flavoprotein n=1 Tax=Paracoccus lutimaris TaxID=1490030 RepID=A0A368YJZ0_9RHOB|nr:GMC family oxidoreductase [Paracoccus lutimaris]RCW80495.1 choline dehydrogenase-like flavoprotein [Paracoccus lutimaris]
MESIRPDVVIIGSGVGGGAVAHRLAGSGARILILERGDFLPNEPQNADAEAVFVQARYKTREEYQDETGRRYRPGQYYYVGGHTKFYGTAMFRFREGDFRETAHEGGISPAWPISYADLAGHYDEAERLFGVRGEAGQDPTEPPRAAPYAHAAIPHEPVLARMAEALRGQGLRPFHMPSAVDFGPGGNCRRCGTCDAFICRHDAKGDAETRLIRPLLRHPDVTLWTGAQVTRLIAGADGRISAAEVLRNGQTLRVEAPLFVLSAGAINSALILLRSADDAHPQGLANRSGVVGRYLMNHHLTGLMGLMPLGVNDTKFPKTLAVNDFYHGLPDDPAARGNVQMLGKIQGPMIRAAYPRVPAPLANLLGRHSVDWLCMSEDLPDPESRVRALPGGGVEIAYRPGDRPAHERFVAHIRARLRRIFPMVLRHDFGIEAPSHQCGTVRMGADPATSALDGMCRAHDHANLYVVDAGFFPSSAALNPALTVCAQALRVGTHLRAAWRDDRLAA